MYMKKVVKKTTDHDRELLEASSFRQQKYLMIFVEVELVVNKANLLLADKVVMDLLRVILYLLLKAISILMVSGERNTTQILKMKKVTWT